MKCIKTLLAVSTAAAVLQPASISRTYKILVNVYPV